MKNLFKTEKYLKINTLCGIRHKQFTKEYIKEAISHVGGTLKKWLKDFMENSGHDKSSGKYVWIPKREVELIKLEILYFKENGRWKK